MNLELQRLALAAAHRAVDEMPADELVVMLSAVQRRALEQLSPSLAWAFLAEGLMAPYPAHFLTALRASTGLTRWLPEVQALFGVPQLSDGPEPVDVGLHQLRVLQVAAEVNAPLAVRFAALAHKLGKGGTLPEIWPSHFKHEQRGQALLEGLLQRFAVPAAVADLARLVIDEADRVHRASDLRAGPIAAMLDRVQALAQPARFEQLLCVCTCDYAAYPGHSAASYPKAPRLRRALAAYAGTPVQGLSADAALEARAGSVAQALRGSPSLL